MKPKTHQEEMIFFNQISNWWDESGPMAPLHRMNSTRLSFILEEIKKQFDCVEGRDFLSGRSVLDVGCGAGLVCEPLARLGARVQGIDANETSLSAAQQHAAAMDLSISYQLGLVEDVPPEHKFDVVLALEVVEHVDHPEAFVKACLDRLNPGGIFILSTLNRTKLAYWGAVFFAERVVKWVPEGTHDWHKFLRPSEIRQFLNTSGAEVKTMSGLSYNLFTKEWGLTNTYDMNFILSAQKTN